MKVLYHNLLPCRCKLWYCHICSFHWDKERILHHKNYLIQPTRKHNDTLSVLRVSLISTYFLNNRQCRFYWTKSPYSSKPTKAQMLSKCMLPTELGEREEAIFLTPTPSAIKWPEDFRGLSLSFNNWWPMKLHNLEAKWIPYHPLFWRKNLCKKMDGCRTPLCCP